MPTAPWGRTASGRVRSRPTQGQLAAIAMKASMTRFAFIVALFMDPEACKVIRESSDKVVAPLRALMEELPEL